MGKNPNKHVLTLFNMHQVWYQLLRYSYCGMKSLIVCLPLWQTHYIQSISNYVKYYQYYYFLM